MNKNKKSLISLRVDALNAPIGSNIICPSCKTAHVKKSYQSVFCKTHKGTKCKDNYWNNVDQSKRNNITRISPANNAYFVGVILPQKAFERGFPDVETMKNYINEDDGASIYVENCFCCGLRYEYCLCRDDID